MRIEELYLKAFGPFEERLLRFPREEPGLVIVYGPNEAGKSSALRAIQNLLYGIPENTKDHFHRLPKQIRVGGKLRFEDGESVAFTRRKGRKNTLLAYDVPAESGAPIDSKARGRAAKVNEEAIAVPRLESLVSAIPESLFGSFYGLDHRELSRGARVLLEDDGELGRALFAAGMGTANLRRLLDRLDEEASELFKPRGQNQPIAQSISEFMGLRRAIKDGALRPERFAQARQELEALQAQSAQIDSEIESTRAERARLDRIRRTLADLGRYRLAFEAFGALEAERPLPSDFESRFREAQRRRATAAERQARAEEQIAAEEQRRAALEQTLDHAPELSRAKEEIDSLIERVGGYRDAVEQLPRRQAELDRLQGEIDALLTALGLSEDAPEIAALDVSLADAERIRELTNQRSEVSVRIEAALAECESAREALERSQKDVENLDLPVDMTGLTRVVERARKLGDIDEQLSTDEPSLDAREAEADRGLARLGYWTGTIDEIDRLVFPETPSIDEFAARFERVSRARDDLDRDQAENEHDRQQATLGLARLRGEGAVPSERERDEARRQRNETWRRVRGERGQPLDALDPDLPERFETEMAVADEVSDRLRREAERVEREAQYQAQLARIAAVTEEHAERRIRIQREADETQTAWRAIWEAVGVEPGTPTEMRAFTDRRRRLFDEIQSTRALRQQWLTRRADRDRACESIAHELAQITSDSADGAKGGAFTRLDDAIAAAERRLQASIEAAQVAAQLRAELRSVTARHEQAAATHQRLKADQASHETEWQRAVAGLGLGDAPVAREVDTRLASLEALAQRRRERDQLAERAAKMETNVKRFAADVESVLPRCAPDLTGTDAGAAVPQLRGRLVEAEKQAALAFELDAGLKAKREERAAVIREREAAEEAIRSLREEAGVAEEAGLEPAIEAARLRAEAQRRLSEVESRLLEIGEARTISEMEIEAKEVDGDALPARIERLDAEVDQKAKAARELLEKMFEARQSFEAMDGSAAVAELAADAEARLAAIARNARRYVTLRIAHSILADEIKTYRDENRAPVLDRASRFFERLTLGQYKGVQGVYDDSDRAELVALMPGDTKKTVDQLSAGTRDQLFLALRLATLEIQVERAEPMPLIADDILVEFDDVRSRATLEVLAGLAQKTQILLFSHHRHVLDQAKELGGRVSVVEL